MRQLFSTERWAGRWPSCLSHTLTAPSVQGDRVHQLQKLWPYQSLFWASVNWQSDGLFGYSFSVALPVQALRGLPCLGPFSVVQHGRHIEGPPWLGSFSVVRHVGHLKGPPWLGSFFVVRHVRHLKGPLAGVLLCSSASGACWASLSIVQLLMLVCGGEREATVMLHPL